MDFCLEQQWQRHLHTLHLHQVIHPHLHLHHILHLQLHLPLLLLLNSTTTPIGQLLLLHQAQLQLQPIHRVQRHPLLLRVVVPQAESVLIVVLEGMVNAIPVMEKDITHKWE